MQVNYVGYANPINVSHLEALLPFAVCDDLLDLCSVATGVFDEDSNYQTTSLQLGDFSIEVKIKRLT